MYTGYLHATLILIFVISMILVNIVSYVRFGFRLKGQRLCVVLSIFFCLFAITSSCLNFKTQWVYIQNVLQPGTLATLLAGIAALGTITQLFKNPYVYTTLDPQLGTGVFGIVMPSNSSNN